ncbi:hypothetical protein BASA50_005390 [Batrachochytrium salamandrivorans]|uniref:N-acetyltransferase domain-containing protein n=1 Tax=Batrachochytrium salamandrivorans TaxID=1357716 RepID=A0ABQ8FD98_9FUNG|nr:hypothetical protein BASA60_007291 [Batrachochytrium salamandrivorans]KAH6596093.1 hypothetical protein BASA50_005390 [Batrachochytrium salamandrivorans]KAH6601770.1 hypothetical protein BASA61_001797 [Batrachochytrium salamandrivorans]KAH9273863.1 hypothetical protein BASA83_003857 [Batrachochytrium salamandrivorans]
MQSTRPSFRALSTHRPGKTCTKKKLPSAAKPQKNNCFVQTTLQLGQRQQLARKCKECFMEYSSGLAEDEKIHQTYHRKYMNGIRWNISLPQLFTASDRSFIVHLHPRNNPKEWEKGFVCLSSEGRVMGCILAASIVQAHATVGNGTFSNESTPAICGISRIWVAREYRRKGVATRLLDAVRHRYILGTVLAREAIAFSQPSDSGGMLACSYLGQGYRVYLE